MPHKPLRQLKHERGQTMVEFAVVLPVLALLLFGVIQFGIAFNSYLTITDAARAGARKAVVSREASNPSGLAEQAVRDSAGQLDQGQLKVSVSPPPWDPGSTVAVDVSYPYAINLLGLYHFNGTMHSKVQERVE
jgi:Flp pilus assembly protein TadG